VVGAAGETNYKYLDLAEDATKLKRIVYEGNGQLSSVRVG
jgi:hypothetical protein